VSDRLLLVRHGVTEWNRDGRFQGHLDPPLSDDGRAQADLLANRLAASAKDRPMRIVSSPLLRALETAEAIAAAVDASPPEVAHDPRLMELGQGAWEGHTHAELAVSDAERYAAWRKGPWDRQPPDGEPVAEASTRVRAAVTDAVAASDADGRWPLCIVGHGGSLRLVGAWLLDLAPATAWALELDNASLSVLGRAGGEWKLFTWNDVSHLLGRADQHAGEEDGEPLAL
jgi:broad specificity phosphatase PhoE